MKSSIEDLHKRGFVNKEAQDASFQQKSQSELLALLKQEQAVLRTMAAQHLAAKDDHVTSALLEQLATEDCLYTRIAITDCLKKGNAATAKIMCTYLGKIGKNQYHKLPNKVSAKKSYPLPRDIIARTLGKMDVSILSVLFDVLRQEQVRQIREVLDAIGFLVFYHEELAQEVYLEEILQVMITYPQDEIIIWKALVCLSAFPLPKGIEILEQYQQMPGILGKEAMRSLKLVKQKGCKISQ